jgi:5-methylcytosine-specific restriction enzyme subunit McrC
MEVGKNSKQNMVIEHPAKRIIELTEYSPSLFDRQEISEEVGELLWRHYSNQINVEFPSPKTNWQWKLTSQGWVGFIPLTADLVMVLAPKVELANLFRMLEYAYRLNIIFPEGLINSNSLQEFYERLASILAKKTLERGKKGFYRTYLDETDYLPYIRGRIDVPYAIRRPWETQVKCDFEEFTADIQENQIVAWTLSRIARSGLCTLKTQPVVRHSYRALQGLVREIQFLPESCVNRTYNRLNNDYQALHGLCRFFLEKTGPGHQVGRHRMLPFLIDMAYLFELFVAEWLGKNLPPGYVLKKQERVKIGEKKTITFDMDLVVYEIETGAVQCVVDTKYKTPITPDTADIAQVVTYSEAKGCPDAVLVYPVPLGEHIDEWVGQKRVRSLTFSLDGDLEKAGHIFLNNLFLEN